MTKDDPERWAERNELVSLLERESAIYSQSIRQAFIEIPRHAFIPADIQRQAYDNNALPIGMGQTISQPLMVAIMTELLLPAPSKTILEIGTGSGYQAAILARLCRQVISVERIPELSRRAQEVFTRLGLANITCQVGDGTLGWPDSAPYDGIIVTAGAPEIPDLLKKQLADGGRLVVPVGGPTFQVLKLVEFQDNTYRESSHGGCVFVKLIGAQGWKAEF